MSQVALQRDFRWSQLYLCYSSSYIPVYTYTWEVLCTCIRKGLALSRSGTLNTQEEEDSNSIQKKICCREIIFTAWNITLLEYFLSPQLTKVIILIHPFLSAYAWVFCMLKKKDFPHFLQNSWKQMSSVRSWLSPTSVKLQSNFHASEAAPNRTVSSIFSTSSLYCHIWPTLILQAPQRISLHFPIFWQLHL